MKSMKCPSCGNVVKKDSQFCTICGTKLTDEATPAPASAQTSAQSSAQTPARADAPAAKPLVTPAAMDASSIFAEQERRARKKTIKKTFILIAAVLVVLAAGGLSAWKFLFSGNGSQGESPTSAPANEDATTEIGGTASADDSAFSDYLGTWICKDYDNAGTELTLQVAFYYDASESSYFECYWEYPRDFDASKSMGQTYPQDINVDNVASKLEAAYGDQFAYFTRITGENGGIVDSTGAFRFDLSEDGQTLIMTVDAYGNKQQTNRLKSHYELVPHPDYPSGSAYTTSFLSSTFGADVSDRNWYLQREDAKQPIRFYEDGIAKLPAGTGSWFMEDGRIWVIIAESDGSQTKCWFCFSNANLDILNNVYADEDGAAQVNVYSHSPYESTASE